MVDLTRNAWEALPSSVFKAAWMCCGYFGSSHFDQFGGAELDFSAAKNLLEPYHGANGSPQRCMVYEWQIKARYVVGCMQHR